MLQLFYLLMSIRVPTEAHTNVTSSRGKGKMATQAKHSNVVVERRNKEGEKRKIIHCSSQMDSTGKWKRRKHTKRCSDDESRCKEENVVHLFFLTIWHTLATVCAVFRRRNSNWQRKVKVTVVVGIRSESNIEQNTFMNKNGKR